METNWILKQEVIDAIEDAFDGPACIYRNLGTSNKYWEPKFKSRQGVKKKTAEKIALRFIRRLHEVNERTFTEGGLDTKKAMKYYRRYETVVRTDDVSSMIEQLPAQPKAEQSADSPAESKIPRIGGAAG